MGGAWEGEVWGVGGELGWMSVWVVCAPPSSFSVRRESFCTAFPLSDLGFKGTVSNSKVFS